MSCTCKDENGNYLDQCIGTCSSGKMIVKSYIDSIKEIENNLNQILSKIEIKFNNIINSLEFKINDSYKEGFQEGFKLGVETERN